MRLSNNRARSLALHSVHTKASHFGFVASGASHGPSMAVMARELGDAISASVCLCKEAEVYCAHLVSEIGGDRRRR